MVKTGVRVAALGILLGIAILVCVGLISLLRPGGDSIEDPDEAVLRHTIAERCGIPEGVLVDPDIWSGGASWTDNRTGRRVRMSFGGDPDVCG